MNDGIYTTLGKDGKAETEVHKSVFIGSAKHVTTEKEAIDFINLVRKEFSDANHNVYAYTLKNGNITRYSDDGEPQGTAGLPVLDYIRKTGFTDACVVVTRYFGGTLLGKGGLVRAYTDCARLCCENGGIVSFENYFTCEIRTDYSELEKIRYESKFFGVIEDDCEYSDKIVLKFAVKQAHYESLCARFAEVFNGKLNVVKTGERFDKV